MPVQPVHTFCVFPGANEGRHDTEHADFRVLDKNTEVAPGRHAII